MFAEQPDTAARLLGLAEAHSQREPVPWARSTPTLELDELQLGQLRALGYAIP